MLGQRDQRAGAHAAPVLGQLIPGAPRATQHLRDCFGRGEIFGQQLEIRILEDSRRGRLHEPLSARREPPSS